MSPYHWLDDCVETSNAADMAAAAAWRDLLAQADAGAAMIRGTAEAVAELLPETALRLRAAAAAIHASCDRVRGEVPGRVEIEASEVDRG